MAEKRLKRIVRKQDDVVILELNDGQFTVCQLLFNSYIAFFLVEQKDMDFKGLDLNAEELLFIVPVTNQFMRARAIKKAGKAVTPRENVEVPELWLSEKMFVRKEPGIGGDLVRLDPAMGSEGINDEVVQADIDPDTTDINAYEMCNIQTDFPLAERLVLCLREGRNVSPLKEFVWRGKDPWGVFDDEGKGIPDNGLIARPGN